MVRKSQENVVELRNSQQTCGTTSATEGGDGADEPGVLRSEPAICAKETVPPPVAFPRDGVATAAIPADLDLAEQVKYHYFQAARGQINDSDAEEQSDNDCV